MRAIAGSSERGPIASSAVVLGSLAILTFTVLTGHRVLETALVVAVLATTAAAYRTLLQWRFLLGAILAVILFIPIRRYTLPGNLPFSLELYRLLVALVLAAWFISLLADRRVRLRRSFFDVQLGLVCAAVLGSVVMNPGLVNSLGPTVPKALSFFVSYILVYYLIVSVVRDLPTVDFLTKLLVGGGAVVAFFGLVERRTGYNVFDHLSGIIPLLRFEGARAGLERGGARLRVAGPAEHPIALGALFVILVPLAIYVARRTGQRRWWVALTLLGLGALSTVSRTAVIMLGVVGLVFLWLRPRQTKRLWPLLVPALALVHFALPGTLGSLRGAFFPEGGLIAEQQRVVPGNELRSDGRLADIGPTLRQVARRPLLGQGYGTRVVGFDEKYNNAAILDDQWLGTLLETGIVGVVAWIWIFGRSIRRLGRGAREDDSHRAWLCVALAASIAAFGVGMLTYDTFGFTQITFVFFVLLALSSVLLSGTRTPHLAERAT
jgi:O-antigen ligase